MLRNLILVSTLLLFSSCIAPIQNKSMPEPAADTQPITQTDGAPEIPAAATQLVEQIKADLGTQKSIDISQIEIVSAEAVTWPDGSLGCPKPGKMYTQALIDGYKLVLKAKGQEFEYHSGGAHFVLCEK